MKKIISLLILSLMLISIMPVMAYAGSCLQISVKRQSSYVFDGKVVPE